MWSTPSQPDGTPPSPPTTSHHGGIAPAQKAGAISVPPAKSFRLKITWNPRAPLAIRQDAPTTSFPATSRLCRMSNSGTESVEIVENQLPEGHTYPGMTYERADDLAVPLREAGGHGCTHCASSLPAPPSNRYPPRLSSRYPQRLSRT